MVMIPVRDIRGNQYDKAFELFHLPVVARDLCTFIIPSSRDPGESDHLVRLDDPERPGAVSCTCMAGQMEKPCWAMARSLIALDALLQDNVWICRGARSAQAGIEQSAGALVEVARVGFIEGEPALLWGEGHPEAGLLYSISH